MELGKRGRGEGGWIAKGQEMLDGWGEMLDHCEDVGAGKKQNTLCLPDKLEPFLEITLPF
jgi:hypothetical protein